MSLLQYAKTTENYEFKRIELINLTDPELDNLISKCLKQKYKTGILDFNGKRESGTFGIDNPTINKGLSDLVDPFSGNGYVYDLNSPSVECRIEAK